MASKESPAKKTAAKKSIPKKAASKKTVSRKAKTASKKSIAGKIIPSMAIGETQTSGDCMCRQKKPNGNFFCFSLIQGRWVQSSWVPFPTQELCEEANC